MRAQAASGIGDAVGEVMTKNVQEMARLEHDLCINVRTHLQVRFLLGPNLFGSCLDS